MLGFRVSNCSVAVCVIHVHEINSHEINSHEINSHEVNSHQINTVLWSMVDTVGKCTCVSSLHLASTFHFEPLPLVPWCCECVVCVSLFCSTTVGVLPHGLNLIGQICSVICTNLLFCIILLTDPSLANSIHVQRRPTHALLLSDNDGRGNCHCLCTKIQPVSNPHTLCNLLKYR